MNVWNWQNIPGAISDVGEVLTKMSANERQRLATCDLWVEASGDRPAKIVKSSLLRGDSVNLRLVNSFREVETHRGLLISAGYLRDPLQTEHQLEFGRRLIQLFLRRSYSYRWKQIPDSTTHRFLSQYRAWFAPRIDEAIDRLCYALQELSTYERKDLARLLYSKPCPASGRIVKILDFAFREGDGSILRMTMHRHYGVHLSQGLRFALHVLENGQSVTARETRFATELTQLTILREIHLRHFRITNYNLRHERGIDL